MKSIFITGGTGFIGKSVVEKLKNKYNLTVLTRQEIKSDKINYVQGDILDKELLKNLIENSDIILHIAGLVTGKSKDIKQVNLQGTKNIASLAKNKKVIFISSENTLHNKQGVYGNTKKQAELIISQLKNHLILRPSAVFGKGEIKNLGKIVDICKNKSYIFIPGSGKNIFQPIYVEDLAQFIFNSIEKTGSYTLAGNDQLTLNHFINLSAKILNKKIKKIHIPLFIIRPIVFLLQLLPNPVIRLSQINNLNTNRVYNIEKTIKELKHQPLPIQKALELTLK